MLSSSVLLGILFISAVNCNGGGWGQPNPNTNNPVPPPISQQESSGVQEDNLWWVKNNPFQKPANHPGVERGESQAAPVPQSASNLKPYQPSYQPNGRPQSQITTTFQSNPNSGYNVPESPDCLLRNKADCHSVPPSSVPQSGINYQQQQEITGYPNGDSVSQPNNIIVPETAYRPPKYGDTYNQPTVKPHGPTPPPLPYQQNFPPAIQPLKPIESNHQQSANGQYEPKPYTSFNPEPQNRPTNTPYQPNLQATNNGETQPPYPGCPAAMLCVPESFCNTSGVSMGKPIILSPAEKLFRVALMECSFPTTGEVGVCCRDPNYKDPWPDMVGGNSPHPKDSGSHGNDGQYHPTHHQPGQNNNQQYNPIQSQSSSGFVTTPVQQNIPVNSQGGGFSSGDGCRPSY